MKIEITAYNQFILGRAIFFTEMFKTTGFQIYRRRANNYRMIHNSFCRELAISEGEFDKLYWD